jgi:hypothetical protein
LLPEVLYHYRIHPSSAMHEPSKKYLMGKPATFDLIKKILLETGNYHGEWERLFLYSKLTSFHKSYFILPKNQKTEYLRLVKDSLGTDEQEYLLHKNNLKRRVRVFYDSLLGARLAVAENTVYNILLNCENAFRMCRNKIIEMLFINNVQK